MGAKKVDSINTQFASQHFPPHPLLSSFISPRLIFELTAELLLSLLRHSDWGPLRTHWWCAYVENCSRSIGESGCLWQICLLPLVVSNYFCWATSGPLRARFSRSTSRFRWRCCRVRRLHLLRQHPMRHFQPLPSSSSSFFSILLRHYQLQVR